MDNAQTQAILMAGFKAGAMWGVVFGVVSLLVAAGVRWLWAWLVNRYGSLFRWGGWRRQEDY